MIRTTRSGRIQWLPLLMLVAAVVLGLFSISRKRVDTPGPTPANDLNVLLITVDTTRADRLGCYGYSGIQTPNIDRLAREGVMFSQCISPVPVTLPAHTSIMTGVYPFAHGVRVNTSAPVDNANITLAEILKTNGYRTSALIASVVLNTVYRLDQGFDFYLDVPEQAVEDTAPSAAEGEAVPEQNPNFAERTAGEMADLTIRWLNEFGPEKKFFLWTHFYDPHYPHTPPEPFASRYPHGYLGEIAYMDQQIGRILDELDRLKLTGRTLVVLVGDHGEGCGEHGEESHIWFVYDSTLHVPLLMRLPERLDPATIVSAQVRLVDIAPTVLELLGLKAPEHVNGTSLVPLMDGETDDLRLEAYAETLYPHQTLNYSWLRTLRADGWKYIHAPTPELYNITDDPGELKNLYAANPERGAEFRERLRDVIEEGPILKTDDLKQAVSLNPGLQTQLEGIGYATGVGGELEAFQKELTRFDPEGPDPKDRVDVIKKWTNALADAWQGDPEGAEQALRELTVQEPDVASIRLRLGTLLSKQGKHEEAKENLEKALELAQESNEVHRHLGTLHHKLGNLPKAAEHLQEAIRLRNHDTSAWFELGSVLAAMQLHTDALRAFVECDRLLGGDDAEIKYSIATMLAALQRNEEAERVFTYALGLNPNHAKAHYNLGNNLAQRGETDAALQHYRKALEIRPDFAQARVNLGILLARIDRRDEAVETLYQAVRTDPTLEEGYARLSQLLSVLGRPGDAVDVLTEGLQHHPKNVSFAVNLAALLVLSPRDEIRDGQRAIDVITTAMGVAGEDTPELLNWLAAAQAETGQFDEAVATANKAAELAEKQQKTELLEQIRARIARYQQRQTAR